MAKPEPSDSWDEAWEAYEARLSGSGPAARPMPVALALPPSAAHCRMRRLLKAVALVALGFALGSMAQPLVAMAGLLLWRDGARLVNVLELRPDTIAVPPAMPRPASLAVIGTDEAGRFLAGMAEAVSDGWRDPVALRRMILARRDMPAVRGAALQPLEQLRGLHPLGWGSIRLEVGPAFRPGGLGLELAWWGGGWQVTRLALLDPPRIPG